MTLSLAAEGGEAAVAADPDRLQQVVGNLLENAIKFTPAGGEVRVRVASSAQEVVIEIRTRGGIAPEILPHLFERLGQGGPQAYRKGGLRLGLAIVRHIVELHSGHVRADSAGPGQGSTFTVQLPSRAERPLPGTARARPETITPPASPRADGAGGGRSRGRARVDAPGAQPPRGHGGGSRIDGHGPGGASNT